MLICGDLLKWILCLITYFYSKVLFHLHIVSHAEVTIFLFQCQKRNEGKEKRKKKRKKESTLICDSFYFWKGKWQRHETALLNINRSKKSSSLYLNRSVKELERKIEPWYPNPKQIIENHMMTTTESIHNFQQKACFWLHYWISTQLLIDLEDDDEQLNTLLYSCIWAFNPSLSKDH